MVETILGLLLISMKLYLEMNLKIAIFQCRCLVDIYMLKACCRRCKGSTFHMMILNNLEGLKPTSMDARDPIKVGSPTNWVGKQATKDWSKDKTSQTASLSFVRLILSFLLLLLLLIVGLLGSLWSFLAVR